MRVSMGIIRERHDISLALPSADTIADAAAILRMLSPVNSLLCLTQLLDGEKCVGQLQDALGLSQSHMSQVLRVLRRQGLVRVRTDRNTRCYSLSDHPAVTVFRRVAGRLGLG